MMPATHSDHPASGPSRFWLFHTAGWLLYIPAMAGSRLGAYPLDYMIVSKTVLAVMGFLCSLLLWRLYRWVYPRRLPLTRILLLAVVASYLVALLWTAGDTLTNIPIARWMLGREIRITTLLQLFYGAVYNSFTLLAWSVLYFGIRHHDDWQAARERALEAEALAQKARLEALRYQIQPHFLFNTLNAISTLVVEQRTAEAGRMISRLSDFLRLTVDTPVLDQIPLADELDFIERYLEIEQVRFGDRLTLAIDPAPNTLRALVPSMILQPIVENAIRHGIGSRARGGSLRIEARSVDGALRLTVTDDGPGAGSAPDGVGLANTRERLTRLHDGKHRFVVDSTDRGTSVVIEFPFAVAAP